MFNFLKPIYIICKIIIFLKIMIYLRVLTFNNKYDAKIYLPRQKSGIKGMGRS